MIDGKVQWIINTPSGKNPHRDEVSIRTTAMRLGIPLVTTIRGANAFMEKADNKSETLHVLIEEVKGTQPNIDGGLDGTVFSKKEKEAIRQALDAMYHLYDASFDRNELITRVLKKLQRDNKG